MKQYTLDEVRKMSFAELREIEHPMDLMAANSSQHPMYGGYCRLCSYYQPGDDA